MKKYGCLLLGLFLCLNFSLSAEETFRDQLGNAIREKNHETVLALFAKAAANPDLQYSSAWKGKYREAFEELAPKASWSQRQAWGEVAEKLKIHTGFNPEAMTFLAEAKNLASSDPKNAIYKFTEAHKGWAYMTDDDFWLMAETALNAKDQMAGWRALQGLSFKYRQAKQSEYKKMIHDLYIPSPKMNPQLLVQTYVGGEGRQMIRKVGIDEEGNFYGEGKGFKITYSRDKLISTLEGDVNTNDEGKPHTGGKLYKSWKKAEGPVGELYDFRTGDKYEYKTLQVHTILQQPYLKSSKGWEMWGWSHTEAKKRSLMADSRFIHAWILPEGKIGGLTWTDGGNTVLGKDPKNLGKKVRGISGGFGKGPRLMLCAIDPAKGTIERGKVYHGTIPKYVNDAWGNMIFASDEFSRRAGVSVVDKDFKRVVSMKLGGRISKQTDKYLKTGINSMVLDGRYLILGGYTNSPKVKTRKAHQSKIAGKKGTLDGVFIVLKLY